MSMLTQDLRNTKIVVNLKRLSDNMEKIQTMVGDDVAIMAIVKANAYGHGAVGIAPTLIASGAKYLAVATLKEALELKEANADYPVFILGHTPDRLLHYIIEHDITQTIFSLEQAKQLNCLAQETGRRVKVHIKIDTGFHRLGLPANDASINTITQIAQLSFIDAEGIFTHLALVNDKENAKQYKQFTELISKLELEGVSFKYKHIADSIAAVDYPEYRMNMVRPGALIYGMRGFHKGFVDVEQVLAFQTRISQITKIPKGEGVGYDFLWRARRDSLIATLPFGYADGYPRNLRDKGYVTINGHKAPIIGVICMDQCMADVTDIMNVRENDTAIIYGDGAQETMSIQEACTLAETNKNDIIARLGTRSDRIYIG